MVKIVDSDESCGYSLNSSYSLVETNLMSTATDLEKYCQFSVEKGLFIYVHCPLFLYCSKKCKLSAFLLFCRLLIFFNINFLEKFFMLISFDPDQGRCLVGPNLDTNCSQRSSADHTSR